MRFILGCLALIGLGVIVTIAGCFGLIGFGVASLAKIPAHVTNQFIEHRYAPDLTLIEAAVNKGSFDGLEKTVSADVLAIYHDSHDQLKKLEISGQSYSVMNGVGIGTLHTAIKTYDCLVTISRRARTPTWYS